MTTPSAFPASFPQGPPPGAGAAQAALFDPPTEHWQRLSPRYLPLRRLHAAIAWAVPGLSAALVVGFAWRWWAAGVLVVATLLVIAFRWWRMPKVVGAWGYAERDTDLYVRSGLWMRRLVAVPYGRMQVVEVTSGPVERLFGLARVRMITAASETGAGIPGLEAADAAMLRDRLAERGEHQSMGL